MKSVPTIMELKKVVLLYIIRQVIYLSSRFVAWSTSA